MYGERDAIIPNNNKQRRRLNVCGIYLSLFAPWILFCCVFAAMSFGIRYTMPALSWLIVACGALVVIGTIVLAVSAVKRRFSDPSYHPMWYVFLAVTSLIAFILALVLGQHIWKTYMQDFYAIGHLNQYSYVDPALMRGQQMMDVGEVQFVSAAHLDPRYSIGFRNDGLYCVAPITSGNTPLSVYDFWAVGMNCCDGTANGYKCGHYNNQAARAGVRLVNDYQRSFYRLAVQQAEAAYGVRASHPLFFYWVEDPGAELASRQAAAWRMYFIGMFGHFCLQLLMVVVAACIFGKVGTFVS